MKKKKFYLPICLTLAIFMLTVFRSEYVFSMESETGESETKSNVDRFEQSNFQTLPYELNLSIFFKFLDLENINIMELPFTLGEFWQLGQVCKEYSLIVENCLPDIIAKIYKIFGIDGLMIIWHSRISQGHTIRNAIVEYCKTHKEIILNNLKNLEPKFLDLSMNENCYLVSRKTANCRVHEVRKECFLRLKFASETDLITQEEKTTLLQEINDLLQNKRLKSKTLKLLKSILESNKIGFTQIDYDKECNLISLRYYYDINIKSIFSKHDECALPMRTISRFFAKFGYYDHIKSLLEKNLISVLDLNKMLLEAAKNGCYKVVELLINNGADINFKNKNGTPLTNAANNCYFRVCRLLLKNGANTEETVDFVCIPYTALQSCAFSGYKNIAELLINNGAKIDATSNGNEIALIIAAELGFLAFVRMLLKKGANVNARGQNMETALMRATENGYIEIVDMLLRSGSNINDRDAFDETAYHKAIENNREEIVKLLLKNGATFDQDQKVLEMEIQKPN